MNTYAIVKVGSGDKEHLGVTVDTPNGFPATFIGCGSRRGGTAKRVIRQTTREEYATNPRRCDKCAERSSVVGEVA